MPQVSDDDDDDDDDARIVGWLVGWFACLLACWLAGCLVGQSVLLFAALKHFALSLRTVRIHHRNPWFLSTAKPTEHHHPDTATTQLTNNNARTHNAGSSREDSGPPARLSNLFPPHSERPYVVDHPTLPPVVTVVVCEPNRAARGTGYLRRVGSVRVDLRKCCKQVRGCVSCVCVCVCSWCVVGGWGG